MNENTTITNEEMMTLCIEDIKLDSYFKCPKSLFASKEVNGVKMTTNSKVLYCMLLNLVTLSKENKKIDNNGIYVFMPIPAVMKNLSVSKMTAIGALNALEEAKLIRRVQDKHNKAPKIYVKDYNEYVK